MDIKEIAPYLLFNGNCAEAFRFYQSVLGGKLDMQTYGDAPIPKDQMPSDAKARVIHARLSIGNIGLMGSDAPSEKEHAPAQGTHVTVTAGSAADSKRIFDALAAGGKATMPFNKTFFSDGFGMLVDRFGIPWMINTFRAA